jgi:hypothetical protein
MANPLSAMMTSIALTTGAPTVPPPIILPRDLHIRTVAKYDVSGKGTVASGISISEKDVESMSVANPQRAGDAVSRADVNQGITLAGWDHAMEQMLAHAAEKTRAAYRDVASKILGYLSLPNDWDNDDGVPPQSKTALNALLFLLRVSEYARPPRVFVVGDGEIGLAWDSAGGYAQVGFYDDDEIAIIARSADGERDVRGVYNTLAALPEVQLNEIISLL